MIFHHLINDIQYFAGIHLITEEDKHQIKEELLQLTDELEDLASKGKTEAGNSVHIYVSHINFEATYSYLEADSVQLSLIRVYSINSITMQHRSMFNYQRFSFLIGTNRFLTKNSFSMYKCKPLFFSLLLILFVPPFFIQILYIQKSSIKL